MGKNVNHLTIMKRNVPKSLMSNVTMSTNVTMCQKKNVTTKTNVSMYQRKNVNITLCPNATKSQNKNVTRKLTKNATTFIIMFPAKKPIVNANLKSPTM